jgi:phage recombination protein Bet
MNNALSLNSPQKIINIWEEEQSILEIRKLFAPKLSESEFKCFVGIGKATNLNPFVREIWCVKYQENTPAQIFIGRDGYRKAAQSHKDYDYHQCDAVYENDSFEVKNGEVFHSYKPINRGNLIGAYCIVKRRKSSKPMYVFVELKEYSTNKSMWNNQTGKPATMIKKVAESQCLRASFQDLLGGTYGEEEMDSSVIKNEFFNHSKIIEGSTQTEILKNMLDVNCIDEKTGEIIDIIDDKIINEEQINKIYSIMKEKQFSEERKEKAIDYVTKKYKVEMLLDLKEYQADKFIFDLSNS